MSYTMPQGDIPLVDSAGQWINYFMDQFDQTRVAQGWTDMFQVDIPKYYINLAKNTGIITESEKSKLYELCDLIYAPVIDANIYNNNIKNKCDEILAIYSTSNAKLVANMIKSNSQYWYDNGQRMIRRYCPSGNEVISMALSKSDQNLIMGCMFIGACIALALGLATGGVGIGLLTDIFLGGWLGGVIGYGLSQIC